MHADTTIEARRERDVYGEPRPGTRHLQWGARYGYRLYLRPGGNDRNNPPRGTLLQWRGRHDSYQVLAVRGVSHRGHRTVSPEPGLGDDHPQDSGRHAQHGRDRRRWRHLRVRSDLRGALAC